MHRSILEAAREISLRISLTSACNHSCIYCFREGSAKAKHGLNVKLLIRASQYAQECGINRIRLTGGEPLLVDDIVSIIAAIKGRCSLPIGLTTNGVLLEKCVYGLVNSGLSSINISIPSLVSKRYEEITGSDHLSVVLNGLDAACNASFRSVKVNVPVISDNFKEIHDYLALLQQYPMLKLRFFSILPYENSEQYSPINELDIISEIESYKKIEDYKGRVVVRPHRSPQGQYCCDCKYTSLCSENAVSIRLTSDGFLRPCLLNDHLKCDFSDCSKNTFSKACEIARSLYCNPMEVAKC